MYDILIPPLIDVIINVWAGKPKNLKSKGVFYGDTWVVKSDGYGLMI